MFEKRIVSPRPIRSRGLNYAAMPRFFLAEVAVQQALQSLAVAGLVAGHLISHVASLVTVGETVSWICSGFSMF